MPAVYIVERPIMATSGCSGQATATSGLTSGADLRAAAPALPSISSASPPGPDLPGGAADRLLLIRCGHYKPLRNLDSGASVFWLIHEHLLGLYEVGIIFGAQAR